MYTMKDLVVHGWKSDYDFQSGYTSLVEETIKRELPNSDLKATPHVNSKLTQWKRNYNSLCKILECSGVGFNEHGDSKIDIDNDQREQIVKILFGKDRASGGVVEDTNDAYDALDEHNQNNVNQSSVGQALNKCIRRHQMKLAHDKARMPQAKEDTNLRLDKLTSRIGLSMVQQIDVAEIILEKVEHIDLFMCLPEHGRLTYVMRALEKHGAV
ncbi:hypothetical protein SASPL_138005 [Salvia splendens]|uniref:Myb/SANT-like domain-containing protein n=1 Tax=Salvia splendens TaxID=180675 RepID=A0A8X8ZEK5_SALSN|nr:hypothetical protein SASPL_138005 [Salvia splendens]